MIKNRLYSISQWLMMACLVLSVVSCRETFENIFSDDIVEGEEVMFTATLPSAAVTRAEAGYQVAKEVYQLTIGMFTEDNQKVSEGVYTTMTDDEIGTLKATTPLYWPDTKTAYGFKATAGTETLEADQSTKDQWLLQDRLEGSTVYRTAKEWKTFNVGKGLTDNDEDYKKIPLTLQHKRSLVTIVLKAGEGVSREALAYAVAENNLSATILSYTQDATTNSTTTLAITPLASDTLVNYEADKNGDAENNVSTTRYDAIVEPYDYSTNPSTDLIARISVSGQHYSFYAQNDSKFESNSDSYQLEAGKHLTITVTLSRDSRKVMMSAYIEDWTEEVTTTICDDYGNAGEPIEIKDRAELIDFLSSSTKNKAGNVALISNNIDLEDWSDTYDLNCTLNLGGCTLLSNYRLLNSIGDAACVQNGTIQIGGTVDAAIATTNSGTIEDVKITQKDGTDALATVAGAVINNTGSILKCRSALKVSGGSTEYVGGIAATSTSLDAKIAIIDGCTVTNRVSGGTYGGGIVGKANGYISNNTFEYGITLLQDRTKYKNIVAVKDDSHKTFKAENNAWPTKDEDLEMTNAETNCYDGIIDSQAELLESVTPTYNEDGKNYRLAQNITVDKTIGDVDVALAYNLDGNNKQVSTSAMIFNAITGKVHDLTVYVSSDLIAKPENGATDAIAPLAYEVHGETAEIKYIKVKMATGTRIQAANPAGVVVWAWGGATISNCEVKANIQSWIEKTDASQGRRYAGGIVSTVSKATVTQCIFHSIDNTLTQNRNTKNDNSGTDDGIDEAKIIYFGGIVGGIEKKSESNDTPELMITDCTSFVSVVKDDYHGGILGYSLYLNKNATSDKCQGNWWTKDCNGVGTFAGSVESTIGKRNTITPTEQTNW